MVVWQRTIAEFQAMLSQARRVPRRSHDRDGQRRVGPPGALDRSAYPAGRRLVLVLSDCVGQAWADGTVLRLARGRCQGRAGRDRADVARAAVERLRSAVRAGQDQGQEPRRGGAADGRPGRRSRGRRRRSADPRARAGRALAWPVGWRAGPAWWASQPPAWRFIPERRLARFSSMIPGPRTRGSRCSGR